MVLIDNKKNEELENNGFIKLILPFEEKQFFFDQIIKNELNLRFESIKQNEFSQNFHVTFFESDINYKKEVFNVLTPFFESIITRYFNNFAIEQINLFIKPFGVNSKLLPHQNLTVVDENQFSSFSIWAPMTDTNRNNGTMFVLPKSHKFGGKYRYIKPSWPLHQFFLVNEFKGLTEIEVSKNEILIINDRLVHGTSDNLSNKSRNVLHAVVKPIPAIPVFCEKIKDEIFVFEVDKNFWQTHWPASNINSKQFKLLQRLKSPDFSENYLPIVNLINKESKP